MPNKNKKIIFGVDPGIGRVGVAILTKEASKESLLYSGCIETGTKDAPENRVKQIGFEISALIKKYSPNTLAIEKLFFNTNQKTAMAVAQARGVIIYEASLKNLAIEEFTPPQIKSAVTGYGKSDKKQVRFMVKKILKIDKKALDDEYDAIAIALTSSAQRQVVKK